MTRNDTLTLVIEPKNLTNVLEAIATASNAWVSNAPAAGLVEKISQYGSANALSVKIGLDIWSAGGGWQTHLTANRNMCVIITLRKDCNINVQFMGTGVPIYRSTFIETVLHAIRSILLNAADYPEPELVV